MRVEDYFIKGRRGWVKLYKRGNKSYLMPCHHRLDEMLDEYIEETKLAGDPKGWLFRSASNNVGTALTERPMSQQDVYAMIRRRAVAAGIKSKVCCDTFRASGIKAYLQNGGKLEVAQAMPVHKSARTTGLYDWRNDAVSLDEVEKIGI
jgi:site-specific recombinase XerD